MIDLVLALTSAAALTQRKESQLSILIFASICYSYGLLSDYISNDYFYYIAAAYTDLLIIHFLSKISNPNKTVILLQKVCLCFIGINFIGFAVYCLSLPPIIYSFSCEVLYTAALLIAIFEDFDHGKYRGYSKFRSFFGSFYQSFVVVRGNKTALKNKKII
jgi:hypothetical protein